MIYLKIDNTTAARLIREHLQKNPKETMQTFAMKTGVNKSTLENLIYSPHIPTLPVLVPLLKATGYELQIRSRKVPKCPCETCDHPGKDCSNVCFPFKDYVRALEKRKGQIARMKAETRGNR